MEKLKPFKINTGGRKHCQFWIKQSIYEELKKTSKINKITMQELVNQILNHYTDNNC